MVGIESFHPGERILLRDVSRVNHARSAFSNVISALVNKNRGQAQHVPFRDSRLTRLLTDHMTHGITRGIYCVNTNSQM